MRGLFTDKELDDIEARYKSAECDLIDALKHQVNMLQDRVNELERTSDAWNDLQSAIDRLEGIK